MYVWSAKANGFFPISEKEKFEASGLWPDDGVIVSEEEHKKLFMDIPPGKQIGTLNGKPALIDIPQPTKKELIAIAEVKKSQLREKADSEISWRQDAVDADIATCGQAECQPPQAGLPRSPDGFTFTVKEHQRTARQVAHRIIRPRHPLRGHRRMRLPYPAELLAYQLKAVKHQVPYAAGRPREQ